MPVKKAYGDALVAIYQNGERLMPGNGYPMRLLLPGYQGNMNVKFLRRIKVGRSARASSFYEARTYSQLLPDGKAYRFHFLQEVKSFITHRRSDKASRGLATTRSPASPIPAPAASPRSWSRPTAARAGREAALQGAVQPQAFTRFRMPWRWDGQPAVLQSRAWDEAGSAQPLRADFVAVRGETKQPVANASSASPTSTTTA